MPASILTWPADSICLSASWQGVTALPGTGLSEDVYRRTCRTTFSQPGFCVINLGPELDSFTFRQRMVDLKQGLSAIHQAQRGKTLVYLSAARFDQQSTTKPHLDGGPEECFLMLGYEPSQIDSELEIIDFARCAFDLGISPRELLERHNPMFASGYEMLRPYATRVPCFSRTDYQIVCINNSSAPVTADHSTWLGTLHAARILTPDENQRRVVNSTMIASVPIGTAETVTESQQAEFVRTTAVRRAGYDKKHLEDDA